MKSKSFNELMYYFCDAVSPEKFTVHEPYSIFLCGGRLDYTDSGIEKCISLRDFIYKYINIYNIKIKDRIILAEKVYDMFTGVHYSDLLKLETELASLVSTIMLVIESSGSMVEFGSFTQIKEIADKFLVIIKEEHYNTSDSFIKLGPIRHMEKQTLGKVCPYHWEYIEGDRDTKYINHRDLNRSIEFILEDITKFEENNVSQKRKFNVDNPGHKMLLIASIINIMGALSHREIETVSKYILKDNYEIGRSEIERYIYMLYKLEFIQHRTVGDYKFYISYKNHINFSYKKEFKVKNILRWQSLFRECIIKNEERRKQVI